MNSTYTRTIFAALALLFAGVQTAGAAVVFKGTSRKGKKGQKWFVRLKSDRCYWFSGAAGEDVGDIRFKLYKPDRLRVENERADSDEIVVKYCAPVAGVYQAKLAIPKAKEKFMLGVYDAKPADILRPRRTVPVGPGKQLERDIERLAAATAPGARRSHPFFSGSSETSDYNVTLQAGKCYWFIAAGQKSISRLYLYLWNGANQRLTHRFSKSRKSSIGHCPSSSGMFRLQTKIVRGRGMYKVGLYEKAK